MNSTRVELITTYNDAITYVQKDTIKIFGMDIFNTPVCRVFERMDDSKMGQVQTISSYGSTIMLTQYGRLFGVGANVLQNLGDGTTDNAIVPVAVNTNGYLLGKKVDKIFASFYAVFVTTQDKKLYGWGSLATGIVSMPTEIPLATSSVKNALITTFLMEDGTLYESRQDKLVLKQDVPLNSTKIINIFFFDDDGYALVTNTYDILLQNTVDQRSSGYENLLVPTTNSFVYLKQPIEFNLRSVVLMSRWSVSGVNSLIAILNDGRAFIGTTSWSLYYNNVNTTLTTKNIIVLTDNTMIVHFHDYDSVKPSVITKFPFQKNDNIKKIKQVQRTPAGISAIMLKCSEDYTGTNCDIPVCYSKSRDDQTVCSGHGKCVEPQTCSCNSAIYAGIECQEISSFALTLLIAGSVSIGTVACAIALVFAVWLIIVCSLAVKRFKRQRDAEIEMKSLLHESLIRNDALSELVDRDWVISLGDLTFLEKLSEGSFGVVFKGRYQNADV